jgi:GNAT superfamily N-acetyltransferase
MIGERFHIRPPSRDEYEDVCRCLAAAHGSEYFSPEMYDAAQIAGSDAYEILCAFDRGGDFAGMFAVIRGASVRADVITLGMLAVDPRFSGQGTAGALMDYVIDMIKSRGGTAAMKAQIVTRHSAVQKMVEKRGFIPTGMLRCVREGRNAEPRAEGKLSLALYAANISMRGAGCLYVHRDISELARSVYKQLDIKAEFVYDGKIGSSGETTVEYDAHNRVVCLQAPAFGIDSLAKIEEALKAHDSPNAATATVLLNLSHPSAIYGYESLRGGGYLFSGFDPLARQPYAVFYKGGAAAADIQMTERLAKFCEEVKAV